MATRQPDRRLSEIAAKPTFRTIDGVSIRFVESDWRDADALLLSPWPESLVNAWWADGFKTSMKTSTAIAASSRARLCAIDRYEDVTPNLIQEVL